MHAAQHIDDQDHGKWVVPEELEWLGEDSIGHHNGSEDYMNDDMVLEDAMVAGEHQHHNDYSMPKHAYKDFKEPPDGHKMPDSSNEWEGHVEERLTRLHSHVETGMSRLHQHMEGKLTWGEFHQTMQDNFKTITDSHHKAVMELWASLATQQSSVDDSMRQMSEKHAHEVQNLRKELDELRHNIIELQNNQSSWSTTLMIWLLVIFAGALIILTMRPKSKRSIL